MDLDSFFIYKTTSPLTITVARSTAPPPEPDPYYVLRNICTNSTPLPESSAPEFYSLDGDEDTDDRRIKRPRLANDEPNNCRFKSPMLRLHKVLPVTDSTWQSQVLESDLPVLVEFWAPWCGPCCMIHPVIDELAIEYNGKLACYKVNTDESPSIATKYGIRSIPTIIVFKGGEKKDAIIGAVPKSTLCTCIEKFL